MKRITQLILIVGLFAQINPAQAQDGEKLFKGKCGTCHILGKPSTGPDITGVKSKWESAGELDNLYLWIKNSSTLISSGQSQMANKIKDFSATVMPPQQVSDEEITSILEYVENPPAPPVAPAAATGDPAALSQAVVPDYKANLTLFYFLSALIILQLIAIIVLSGVTKNFIQSDYFQKKIKEISNNVTPVLLIGLVLLVSQQAYAFSFNGSDGIDNDLPWLKIEESDLWVMGFINVILLTVVLYLRRLFFVFFLMVKPKTEKEEAAAPVASKLNQILTDRVALEDEHKIMMAHEYDGIRELDNNLPPWWLWMFYGTVIFAVVYLFNYHVLKTGDLQAVQYDKEMAAAKVEVDAYLKEMAMNVDETNVVLLTDASALSSGKKLFDENCATCHLSNGSGEIGPNLTDDYWIYSNDIKDIFKTIKYGTPNGMPEHQGKLNPVQLQEVGSYVLSLPFAEGQKPQGKLIPKNK